MLATRHHQTCLVFIELLLALGLTALSPDLVAQPTVAASASATAPDHATLTARARFSQAVPLMKQARWRDAYLLLLEAWQNKRHWQIALNLGRTELELAKYRDAVEHLTFAGDASDAPPESHNEATLLKKEASAKLGYLAIEASPPGARVFIGGKLTGRAPLTAPIAVDPGSYDVEIRFGGRRQGLRVDATSGQTKDVSLAVRLLDLDPTATAITPPRAVPTRDASRDSPPSTSARTWIAVAGAGLTGIGLGVGIGATVASFGKSSELDAKELTPENLPIERDRVLLANVAVWSFVGAGVVAGATIASILLWPTPAKQGMTVELRTAGTSLLLTGQW